MAGIELHEAEIDGVPVVWRSAPRDGTPVLWLHGVPNSSEMWTPFLERAGGIAVDLPGFGRSGKSGALDYSIAGYATFIERFLDHLDIDRVSLAMHDWGGVGLAFAQRRPERVERLAAIAVVPFLPGFRWHRVARLWRTPVVGELTMGFTSLRTLRLATRDANAQPLPASFHEAVMRHFDHGTQRAILRLYRSASPAALAAAGADLGTVGAPALVVWGDRDPYLQAASLAEDLAAALGCATEVLHFPDAGHWPWLDDPAAISGVTDFLDGYRNLASATRGAV
jgi:pimeloyl-ACP methyl ester carboxylesterase